MIDMYELFSEGDTFEAGSRDYKLFRRQRDGVVISVLQAWLKHTPDGAALMPASRVKALRLSWECKYRPFTVMK